MTLSLRDATETYLELGQRIPIYLNGEIQIAWVLEQGLVDMAFIVRTFGIQNIRRDQVISRGPRFHIAFDANAADKVGSTSVESLNQFSNNPLQPGAGNPSRLGAANSQFGSANTPGSLTSGQNNAKPSIEGRYELMRCKVDSVSLGVMPGRRVAAVRWEGVSEGISFVGASLQEFKDGLSQGIGAAGARTPLGASQNSGNQATGNG